GCGGGSAPSESVLGSRLPVSARQSRRPTAPQSASAAIRVDCGPAGGAPGTPAGPPGRQALRLGSDCPRGRKTPASLASVRRRPTESDPAGTTGPVAPAPAGSRVGPPPDPSRRSPP